MLAAGAVPADGAGAGSVGSLARRFRQQAEQCARHGSPLTAALLTGAADELGRPGPVRDLLAPFADDPAGSMASLRFAGALHRLVLLRRAPALALCYPSVGGTAPPGQAWPAAREVVAAEDLTQLVRAPVQTNEPGRSAVLYGGLLHLAATHALPVRLLEVGASAGLNLSPESFAYEVGDRVLGDPASPVRLRQPWQGAPPAHGRGVHVLERRGCDPAPLSAASTADRLTLTSYVWADQVERVERLRGALEVARRTRPPVEELPASAFLLRELAALRPGVLTVLWHSVVWQYLEPAERREVERVIADAGGRATADAPLARLSLEPERTGRFAVDLTIWPGGGTRRLATAQGHGPPVVWG